MQLTNKKILGILLIIFLLPLICSVWLYSHKSYVANYKTNRGELLKESIFIPELQSSRPWQLVYIVNQACTDLCMHDLTNLAKMRLSLGRKLYNVQLTLAQAPVFNKQKLQDMDVKFVNIRHIPNSLSVPKVWLLDAKGRVVLVYQDTSKLNDIYSDLKHLI
ncbi:MAG: hypothetical protein A3F18_07725 [Legionellales bacterium RIFCSPHIGHO2_12_FULL_37_14]|nr:MAG: hypothetical protein A3F18_07725 [Legionellales bacterium RIFCSPHIGHO2_12_FULL_37_14]